jgi:carboxymethylenebutenolidase
MGELIEYSRPDGNTTPGYYTAPKQENAPGIVLIEEWWGVTAEMMAIADRYAQLGYRVLLPDLFRGRTAATGDEANHLMEGLDFSDAAMHDVRGAIAHLKKSGTKVGVTGYCMGGALALLNAMHAKEADAAVIFYGFPPADAGDPATIEIPIQCHFAKHDDFFRPAGAEKLEERLKAGKVPYELFWYEAKHAFANPNPPGNAGLGHYDAAAAHLSWERALRYWKNTLT